MKHFVTAAAMVCLVICAAQERTFAAANQPNIVYIIADDLGYADIGVQGLSKDVKTPNVDAIAAAGVRFTNGYVSCPVCSPTRAGLLTGRYQQRFGFEVNPGPNESDIFGLPVDQITLAQTLKDAGYVTSAVGKWHLGFKPEMHPNKRGFDEFFGFLAGAHSYNAVGKDRNAMMRGDKPLDSVEYLTDAFGKEAVAFIDRQAAREKPFFLYLSFNAIHTPMEAPAKYQQRFANVTDPKRKTMLAMLSAMDDAVGNVVATLKKQEMLDNTLIVFHSDNGGPTAGNASINTPLRGFKGTPFEGGVRVPFMMQWNGKLPAGKVYDKPVIALDMFPTMVAAAGGKLPANVKLDGVDLMPHLTTEAGAVPHETLYWRYGRQKWAIRDGDYKLVQADRQSPAQLYDLAKDVGEQKDLSAEKPEVVKALQAKFDAWSSQMEKPRWQDTRDEKGKAGGKRRQQRQQAK